MTDTAAIDPQQHPILVVDDERDNLDIFRFNFRKTHPLVFAENAGEALTLLADKPVSVIVTDQRMPGKTGLELLREARALRPGTVNILVTGYADVPTLADAINEGLIHRYIAKPWSSEDMTLALRSAVETAHLRAENERLVAQLKAVNHYLVDETHAPFNYGDIVGESASLKKVLDVVERVAPTDSTVLIRGESGTGKELIARAVHLNSSRADGPFVKVNCAALSTGVLESELFGHEKGSFTGAVGRRPGRFELADGGTIFLDEVGDIPLDVQVKLLRVLQEREFERVGGTETIKVNVRVVSATHRNIEDLISKGQFREDLYYRLNVFPVVIPPLRERADDAQRLAAHFAKKFSHRMGRAFEGFAPDALEAIRSYPWPGNVRELENAMERAVILGSDGTLRAEHLHLRQLASAPAAVATRAGASLGEELDGLEKNRLAASLEKHRGRKTDVAKELGINRTTLYYRLKKYGFE